MPSVNAASEVDPDGTPVLPAVILGHAGLAITMDIGGHDGMDAKRAALSLPHKAIPDPIIISGSQKVTAPQLARVAQNHSGFTLRR